MNTRSAVTVIFSAAFLSGACGALFLAAVSRVRPPIRDDWPTLVFFLITLGLPIVIVFLVWRTTSELRFTGVLVALAAMLFSGVGSVVGFVAGCLASGGRCM